jgi:hypothetical protein
MTTDPYPWLVERSQEEVEALFAPGTRIRSLHPELTSWRGTVTPMPRAKRWIEVTPELDGGFYVAVRVKWDNDGRAPAWHGADALAPLKEEGVNDDT